MSVIPASSLSSSDLLHLGNNVLPRVSRDRLEQRSAANHYVAAPKHSDRLFCQGPISGCKSSSKFK